MSLDSGASSCDQHWNTTRFALSYVAPESAVVLSSCLHFLKIVVK